MGNRNGWCFSARLDGQLIKHIFLSPNQLLAQLVLGEISIYLRGQQWVLILLVPPSEIRSKSSPVTSETLLWSRRLQRESSRDLRGCKFWESCKFRKFPRSTLERGVIRFMKTSHSHRPAVWARNVFILSDPVFLPMSSELIENQGQQRHAINGLVVFNLNCCIFELNIVVFSLKILSNQNGPERN